MPDMPASAAPETSPSARGSATRTAPGVAASPPNTPPSRTSPPDVCEVAAADRDFDLRIDPKTRIILVRPGQDDLPDVRVRRAFPWSMPDQYISVRSKEGKEVLMIRDLGRLPPDLQARVRQAIHISTFIPRIERIVTLTMQFGQQQWEVVTDRGPTAFRVQEREDIKTHADGRRSVKDADGNTYELPPDEQLDPVSRRLLQQII